MEHTLDSECRVVCAGLGGSVVAQKTARLTNHNIRNGTGTGNGPTMPVVRRVHQALQLDSNGGHSAPPGGAYVHLMAEDAGRPPGHGAPLSGTHGKGRPPRWVMGMWQTMEANEEPSAPQLEATSDDSAQGG